MVLKSDQYDDVYFSAQDGLAETRYVFLDGNNLPEAWIGKDVFRIGETGFGTGLNFYAVWALFVQTAELGQVLHFTSFEKFPLSAEVIREALAPWEAEIGPYMNQFLSQYSQDIDGIHQFDFGQVKLTLYVGDIAGNLPRVVGKMHCWFLDGFSPAKNPDMWTDEILQKVGDLTHDFGSFATFTVAGNVRRSMTFGGFCLNKLPGFGRKREMLTGIKKND